MKIHTVSQDEDIYGIASEYSASPQMLCEVNGISYTKRLCEGARLIIPEPTRTYNVKRGDSVLGICNRFGISEPELYMYNPALCARDRLYPGQLLAIKYGENTLGALRANGYFFRGCTEEKLRRTLPYLSYLTVCSARVDQRGLGFSFDGDGLVDICEKSGKKGVLRIYFKCPIDERENRKKEIINDIVLTAKSKRFFGITVAGVAKELTPMPLFSAFMLELKKKCLECDLALFCEADAGENLAFTEFADCTVLSYDKLPLPEIPSFSDGEGRVFTEYAESFDAPRTFIDVGAFGLCEGKYIPKESLLSAREHRSTEVEFDADTLLEYSLCGKRKKKRALLEGPDSIKAKLELASELGYLGICFDIERVPISDLFIFGVMFGKSTARISML